MKYIVLIVSSYFIGSIPFAYIIGKFVKSIDIREVGSRNPGAANVFREVSPFWGITTFILDFSKGFIPPFLAVKLNLNPIIVILCAILTVIGHNWSIFLKFRGGGGLSTSLGAAFSIIPVETLIVAFVFLALFLYGKIRKKGVVPGLTPLIGAGAVSYFVGFILIIVFRENLYTFVFLAILILIQVLRHGRSIVKWIKERRI